MTGHIHLTTAVGRHHMRAARLNAYGDPSRVIAVVEVPDPPAPGPGEVLVGVELAPVNPADLLMALGHYVIKPPLPSLLRHEGVATVLAVGPAVGNVAR